MMMDPLQIQAAHRGKITMRRRARGYLRRYYLAILFSSGDVLA